MTRAFTLIELLLTIAIIATLVGVSSILLSNIIPQASVVSAAETLQSEIRNQQLKAMMGKEDSTGNANNYGIYFQADRYTLFEGASYDPTATGNIVYELNSAASISTSFPGQQLVFERGSGEILNYVSGSATVTVSDAPGSATRVLNFNSYGVPE